LGAPSTRRRCSGPLAKELGAGQFLAPQVKEPDRLSFDVIVSDGQATATTVLEVGLEPSSCGCTSAPMNGLLFIVAGLGLLRRRRVAPNGQARRVQAAGATEGDYQRRP